MPLPELLLVALGIAMDAFAVCLAVGSLPAARGPRPAFRLAFHFGLFQGIMPVLGWLAGATIEPMIRDWDHWIAFALLAFVGIRMISATSRPEVTGTVDLSRGWSLVLLSIAVSLDALAVGLSFGLLGIFVVYPAILIGLVTGVVSWFGLQLGNRVGARFGRWVQILGGLVLVAMGWRIVLQHVML